MPSYDLLKTALADAMSYSQQPVKYSDIYGDVMKRREIDRQDESRQRQSDMQDELQSSLSELDGEPSVDQIRNIRLKTGLKYGDANTVDSILKETDLENQKKEQAKEKESEKLAKQLKDVAELSSKDPTFGRMVRDQYGLTDRVPDQNTTQIYENSKKGRRAASGGSGGGGGSGFVYMYGPDNEVITVDKNRDSIDGALSRGYLPKKRSASGLDSFGNDQTPPEKGADITARENSQTPNEDKSSGFLSSMLSAITDPFSKKPIEVQAVKEGTPITAVDPQTGKRIIVDPTKLKRKESR
jgi:hypothetical protein